MTTPAPNWTVGHLNKLTIACHQCGQPIDGTTGRTMCVECIKMTASISSQVSREGNVQFCRNCERYLLPPQTWIPAPPESRELLAILLKRLQGLSKARIIDAKFLWTEPHSRRIKVKITIQGEAQPGVILQEDFDVEYVVIATQCPDCAKLFTVHTWRSCVQLRQKVQHKRTFLYLEQLIMKHNAHLDTVSIEESRDGIDFFFSKPNHAIKFQDFITQVAPIRAKRSEQLISTDTHTGSSQFKFTHSIEIAPICRDDLVVLPRNVAHRYGNIAPVVLCSRITSSMQFLDPTTLQKMELPADIYWREPFPALASQVQLQEFIVLDLDYLGPMDGRNVLVDVMVARASDMGQTYVVRSHLGGLLHVGDSALGYFLVNSNFNNEEWDKLGDRPDIVLVKKFYPYRKANRHRNWKIKRMAKEYNEMPDAQQEERAEQDMENFLRDLEQDEELRQSVNLYKNKNHQQTMEDEDEGPSIAVDELLEDMDDLDL